MSSLTGEQRQAILRRYGGFVRTYFSDQELREATFGYRSTLARVDVEFYAYIRLSTVLLAGEELVRVLGRIVLAPSVVQERYRADSRGVVDGPLDTQTYARRRGQVTTPRSFPVWRVRSTARTPENALAAIASIAVLDEIQVLTSQVPVDEYGEAVLARSVVDALEEYLRHPALGEAYTLSLPSLFSDDADDLLDRVEERWGTRRISNIAYGELARWARHYRELGLAVDRSCDLRGVAYSDAFDDRLFEIYVLSCFYDAFKGLGFVVDRRPLHKRSNDPLPVLIAHHADSGLRIKVHFQRGSRVAWTQQSPREWPDIGGIPDIALDPDSSHHPLILVDAKNRYRGEDSVDPTSDERYKMLGYFHNFARRMEVAGRGPVGALVYPSRGGGSRVEAYRSDSGEGALFAVALDPCADPGDGNNEAGPLLTELLTAAGLHADRSNDIAKRLRDIKEASWAPFVDEQNPADVERAEEKTISEVLRLMADTYGRRDDDMRQARQSLDLHILGGTWGGLSGDMQTVLCTGEVFWSRHHFSIAMDFAPAAIEWCRAFEMAVDGMLFGPYRHWAAQEGRPAIPAGLMLGPMIDRLQAARRVRGLGTTHTSSPVALALHEFLIVAGVASYAYDTLIDDLAFIRPYRNKSAHKDMVSCNDARVVRERVLGIGEAPSILARVVATLRHL